GLCDKRTAPGNGYSAETRICQEFLLIHRQRGERNERAVVTCSGRCDEKWIVSAFAQTDRSGCLSRPFPGNSRFGVVALRDVDQLGEVIDLSGINRYSRGPFTIFETLSGQLTFIIRQVWRRPSPISARR